MRRRITRSFLPVSIIVAALGVGIQLIPYGHPAANPPVRVEPRWDTPGTRELAARACFDCHSNQTQYPWYSYVAPVSWLVQRDIDEGRPKLNFSEWDLPQREANNAASQVQKNEMPPAIYLPTHPEARLSETEKQALMDGLRATVDGDRPRRR